jgi:hypothetical protein
MGLGDLNHRYGFPNHRSLRSRELERDVNRRVERFGYQDCRQDDGVRLGCETPKVLADTRDLLSPDGQHLAVVESEPHFPSRHSPSIPGSPDSDRCYPLGRNARREVAGRLGKQPLAALQARAWKPSRLG